MGHLNSERLDRISATVGELVDDLDGHEDIKAIEAPSAVGELGPLVTGEQDEEKTTPQVWQASRSIVCIPGYTKLDETAAIVSLRVYGDEVSVPWRNNPMPCRSPNSSRLDLEGTELVCHLLCRPAFECQTSLCSSQAHQEKQIGVRDGIAARFGVRSLG